MSLPLPSRTVCRANLAVHSLWSETGPTSQMPRAYHCELMYSARRSARAIRLRGIRGEYLLHGFRRSCQFVLQNYLSCFIQDAVRTRAISQMQTIGELVPFYLNACLPSSVWCRPSRLPVSSSLCFEHVDQWERMASRGDRPSHPTRQVFFSDRLRRNPISKGAPFYLAPANRECGAALCALIRLVLFPAPEQRQRSPGVASSYYPRDSFDAGKVTAVMDGRCRKGTESGASACPSQRRWTSAKRLRADIGVLLAASFGQSRLVFDTINLK